MTDRAALIAELRRSASHLWPDGSWLAATSNRHLRAADAIEQLTAQRDAVLALCDEEDDGFPGEWSRLSTYPIRAIYAEGDEG